MDKFSEYKYGKPVHVNKEGNLSINLADITYLALFETGHISWESYAKLVPEERRPKRYKKKPKKLPKPHPEALKKGYYWD